MPRPGTDDEIKRRVWELVENNSKMSAGLIHSKLSNHFAKGIVIPTERTIARIKKDFLGRQSEERRPYRYFSWPESFESGALPWEASQAMLDLLRYSRKVGNPNRPTVRFAQFFWQFTLAAPDMTLAGRADLSAYRQKAEGEPEREKWLRGIEEYLLRTPWRSKREAQSWKKAVQSGQITGCPGHFGCQGWFTLPRIMDSILLKLKSGDFQKYAEKTRAIVSKKLGREATVNDVCDWEEKRSKSSRSRKERKR